MSAVTYSVGGGIAVARIQNPPVNALSHAVRERLVTAIQSADGDPAVRALVIVGSGGTFCAGADIREFGQPSRPPWVMRHPAVTDRCAKPIVAAIAGNALGGGLELALGCHWRLATPKASLGLPEVRLGLLPGAGGTQRLPRLIGVEAALAFMTSGKPVDGTAALAMGLVDGLLESDDIEAEAIAFAQRIADKGIEGRVLSRLDSRVHDVPDSVFDAFEASLRRKARGQLAPFRIVDCVKAACRSGFDEGSQFEMRAFAECLADPRRDALVHVFFSERRAGKVAGLPAGVLPLEIRTAAVVGAGTMGGGIAMSLANAGIPVRLLEKSADALARGLATIDGNYEQSVRRGGLAAGDAERARGLIAGVGGFPDIADADIVIEAVFEDVEIKREVFAALDASMKPGAILATNTSGIDIDSIAAATKRPEWVVGTHFFVPANVMRLLENVRGAATSPAVVASVMALGRRLGKVAVLSGNCDGFIGNRMLRGYLREADFLIEDGASPYQVDRVLEEFGFAMGRFRMGDLAGLDVGWRTRRRLDATRPKDERYSRVADRLYEAGRYGQKTGRGYYLYDGRKPLPDPEVEALIEEVAREAGIRRRPFSDEEVLHRCLLPLVNEGARIVEEGIAQRASDIDVTYVAGYAFPAHRGGPMFWAEQMGLDRIRDQLCALERSEGARWRPAPLLERLAATTLRWES